MESVLINESSSICLVIAGFLNYGRLWVFYWKDAATERCAYGLILPGFRFRGQGEQDLLQNQQAAAPGAKCTPWRPSASPGAIGRGSAQGFPCLCTKIKNKVTE